MQHTVLYAKLWFCKNVGADQECANVAAVHVIVELQTVVLANRQRPNRNYTTIALVAIFAYVRKLT